MGGSDEATDELDWYVIQTTSDASRRPPGRIDADPTERANARLTSGSPLDFPRAPARPSSVGSALPSRRTVEPRPRPPRPPIDSARILPAASEVLPPAGAALLQEMAILHQFLHHLDPAHALCHARRPRVRVARRFRAVECVPSPPFRSSPPVARRLARIRARSRRRRRASRSSRTRARKVSAIPTFRLSRLDGGGEGVHLSQKRGVGDAEIRIDPSPTPKDEGMVLSP